MRALVAGWFSFEAMGATAGDLLACGVVTDWLADAAVPHEVAVAPPFADGIDWREVDPATYTHVVFVCGPFANGWPLTEFLTRFSACRLVGLDVSMLQPLEEWNPFDLLLERDSTRRRRADLSLLSGRPLVPVVGLVRVHPQEEYGDDGAHAAADSLLDQLLASRELAVVPIDTRLDENAAGFRTPSQVESVIARMDVVVTTRLHGLVLSLKNAVPAIAVDPVRPGAKLSRQGETLGWPYVFSVDTKLEALCAALEACLRPEARAAAATTADRGRASLSAVRDRLLAELRADGSD